MAPQPQLLLYGAVGAVVLPTIGITVAAEDLGKLRLDAGHRGALRGARARSNARRSLAALADPAGCAWRRPCWQRSGDIAPSSSGCDDQAKAGSFGRLSQSRADERQRRGGENEA